MTRRRPPEAPAAPSAGTAVGGLPEPALAAQAVEQVLRPLARLMIDHGLQLPSMLERVKKALVQEAADVLAVEDRGGSDSRIALLTGVHRKDVRRLREVLVEQAVLTPMASVTASVVARWISEPRFLNADQS